MTLRGSWHLIMCSWQTEVALCQYASTQADVMAVMSFSMGLLVHYVMLIRVGTILSLS